MCVQKSNIEYHINYALHHTNKLLVLMSKNGKNDKIK